MPGCAGGHRSRFLRGSAGRGAPPAPRMGGSASPPGVGCCRMPHPASHPPLAGRAGGPQGSSAPGAGGRWVTRGLSPQRRGRGGWRQRWRGVPTDAPRSSASVLPARGWGPRGHVWPRSSSETSEHRRRPVQARVDWAGLGEPSRGCGTEPAGGAERGPVGPRSPAAPSCARPAPAGHHPAAK